MADNLKESKLRIFNNKGMTGVEFLTAVENFSYMGPTVRFRSSVPTEDAILVGGHEDLRRVAYHATELGYETDLTP